MLVIAVLTVPSDPSQSIELSMLDGDDVNIFPDSPQDSFEGMTVHLEYFNHSLATWRMHITMPYKYRVAIIIDFIYFKNYF